MFYRQGSRTSSSERPTAWRRSGPRPPGPEPSSSSGSTRPRATADIAEGEPADAIDFAAWAVDHARLAVLDALDARVSAGERAKAAASG